MNNIIENLKQKRLYKIVKNNIENYIKNTQGFHYTRLDIRFKLPRVNEIFNFTKYGVKAQRGSIVIVLLFVFLFFMIVLINIYARSINSLADISEQKNSIESSYHAEVNNIDKIYKSRQNLLSENSQNTID